MDEDVKILERTKEMKYVCFWGGNGYCGCDYEEYQSFEDGIEELEIDLISNEMAYQNAESYEYMVTDRSSDGDYKDIEDYYDDALSYCGWNYCTKEEFEMNTKE